MKEQTHLYPAHQSKILDNKIRRLLQNPFKILKPYISTGMTVLDYGCGSGYFSIPLSEIVGSTGKVYSVDIQKEMLDKLKSKILKLKIANIIPIHTANNNTNLQVSIDFVIAANVIHEIPDKYNFFKEVFETLKPNGKLLMIEPDFIVSRQNFDNTLAIAKQVGFFEYKTINLLLSKTRILIK